MRYLLLIFFLFFSFRACSSDLLPLKIFLKKNNNYQDVSRSIYILKRCASLYNFIYRQEIEFQGYDKKIFIRYEKANDFYLSKLVDTVEKAYPKNKKLMEDSMKDIHKITNIYRADSINNLSKNKSYFKKSYILEDLKICSKIK